MPSPDYALYAGKCFGLGHGVVDLNDDRSLRRFEEMYRNPELGMRADYDSQQAGQTRRKVFDRFCDTSTVMCVVHFPSPSTGRVRRWGDGYKFVA
jgi:hypothetical protein